MTKELHVFDASAFVYVGEMTKNYSLNDLHYNMPIKGIVKLNTYVANSLSRGANVIICFDSKTFRKDVLSCYKAHRVPNREVQIQLDFIYTMYKKYGITCLKEYGLEADDLVYTVSEVCKKLYGEIKIYGCDYDLTHNVDTNVEFLTMSSQVNSVNKDTFETLMKTPFNTIALKKLIYGDSSDGVPAFNGSVSNYELYNLAIDAYTYMKDSNKLKSPNDINAFYFFLRFLTHKNILPSGEIEELKKRATIFYPKASKLKDLEYIANYNNIDSKGFHRFLCETKSTTAYKYFNNQYIGDSEVKEELKKWGNSYKSGKYFTDHNILSTCKKLDSTVINLKGL